MMYEQCRQGSWFPDKILCLWLKVMSTCGVKGQWRHDIEALQ